MIIEEAIAAARCVIVLWSRASVGSEWVRSEATEAKRRGILVPVFLENVPAPLAFRLLSGADLSDWTYGTPHAEYDKLIERVAECLASPGPATEPRAAPVVPADQAAPAGEPHETRRLRTSDRLPPKPAGTVSGASRRPGRIWTAAACVLLLAIGALVVGYLSIRPARPPQSASTAAPDSTPPPTASVEQPSRAPAPAATAPDRPGRTPPASPPRSQESTTQDRSPADSNLFDNVQQLLKDAVPARIERPEDIGLVLSFTTRSRPNKPDVTGALVNRVRGPARNAGVRVGDLITNINGITIDSQASLARAFRDSGGGFRAIIHRGDSISTIELSSRSVNLKPR